MLVALVAPEGGGAVTTSAGSDSLRSSLVEEDAQGAPAAEPSVATDVADVDVDNETPEERRARFDRDVIPLMGPLYGNAMRLTRNSEDAADLVQATFERAFKSFHQYKPGTNLKAWMFKIQNNAFINDYRKKQRQPLLADTDVVEDWQMHRAESHTASGLRSVETEVLEDLPEQVVVEALEQLSEDYREAVLLADVEGLRYQEIADIMGTPIGTVMSRLHRGRRQLRALLEDHARDYGYLPREVTPSGDGSADMLTEEGAESSSGRGGSS